MSAISVAAAELSDAVKTVEGLQVISGGSVELDPPAAVLSAPALDGMALGLGFFTNARFLVTVVVPADDIAVDRLWDLVPQVTEAIDSNSSGKCVSALPTSFPASGGLPAYEITVEVPL